MRFPKDWPVEGAIDLKRHDLPHASSTTEWWYVNAHFKAADGRDLSLFAAFFRIALGYDQAAQDMVHAHALTWAITDATCNKYYSDSRLDQAAPRLGLERISEGRGARDPRLNRAMKEVLERGGVPAPDRLFSGPVTVGLELLDLDYAGAIFKKNGDDSYQLILKNDLDAVGCHLTFHPEKKPILHGDQGVVRGQANEDMFYYFIPRCRLTGLVTLEGKEQEIQVGQGWYDHEFGGYVASLKGQRSPAPLEPVKDVQRRDIAWNWAAVQLQDATEVTAYSLFDAEEGSLLYQWAVHIDADGKQKSFKDFKFEPLSWWRSVRTFHDYPVAWRLVIAEIDLDLALNASFADQEFITVLSDPAFWEGRCQVKGTVGGKLKTGHAYVERSGFETIKTLDDFFSAVGEVVRESVATVLPLNPSADHARNLVASDERAHYMDGLDIDQLSRALIKPIREITDRGGKSWRSYAALACCDVVGGDSRKYVQWLAMPELMHVGSLIVDDVQDRSAIRRGGPACHLIYGEPLAINAGTAAYFLTQKLLYSSETSDASKLRLYDLYFEAMRAGHAGQAIDLDGLSQLMKKVAVSGDARLLEKRVLATHRLKTAAPAAALARMGAVVGGGTNEQIEAVGRFFEALGLAFQLVDDVLNLRGFKGGLKSSGEDIGNGTITVPVAKAMAKLPLEDRLWLCEALASKPKDNPRLIAEVIAKIEDVGALDAVSADASRMVEDAWAQAEPLLDDSVPKIMLRAFGWYVLDRHY